jgi:hypothetical protein
MEKGEITITGKGGTILDVVEGEIYRLLAIHPAYQKPKLWTVSHVPSGCAIKKNIKREQAEAIVNELWHLDWSGTAEEAVERNREAAGPVLRRLCQR